MIGSWPDLESHFISVSMKPITFSQCFPISDDTAAATIREGIKQILEKKGADLENLSTKDVLVVASYAGAVVREANRATSRISGIVRGTPKENKVFIALGKAVAG